MLADLRSVHGCATVEEVLTATAARLAGTSGEVALEPVECRQRGDRRVVLWQPGELKLALGDEAVGERPAAVERGVGALALGAELQFDLGVGEDVGVQQVRGCLRVLAEGGLQMG